LVSEPQPIGRPYGFSPRSPDDPSFSSIGWRRREPAADLATVAWGDLRHSSAVASFACLVGRLFPDGALGIFCPSQFCSCLAGVGAFPPVRAHLPLFAFIHPDRFSSGDGRRVLKPTSVSDGRSRTMQTGFWVFAPQASRTPPSISAGASLVAALGFSSCRFCGRFLYRTAPRACSNTSPRRQPWGWCFHRNPYPLLSLRQWSVRPVRQKAAPAAHIRHCRLFSVLPSLTPRQLRVFRATWNRLPV